VVVPNSVTHLGDGCFSACEQMTAADISGSVDTIPESCFANCTALKDITLHDGVKVLGKECFSSCALTGVHIPETVTATGTGCFQHCYSLTAVDMPKSLTAWPDECFYGCKALTAVTVPEGVTSLGQRCFYMCQGVKTIDLPNTLESIGGGCFGWCKALTAVTIPESVKSIGENCFYYYLKTLTCCQKTPAEGITETSFDATALPKTLLYVPKGCMDNYKNTKPWSMFGCIKEYNGGTDAVTAPTSDVQKVEYFTTDGQRARTDAKGVVISKSTLSDGRTVVNKVIRR
jgi:hypothetical protein